MAAGFSTFACQDVFFRRGHTDSLTRSSLVALAASLDWSEVSP